MRISTQDHVLPEVREALSRRTRTWLIETLDGCADERADVTGTVLVEHLDEEARENQAADGALFRGRIFQQDFTVQFQADPSVLGETPCGPVCLEVTRDFRIVRAVPCGTAYEELVLAFQRAAGELGIDARVSPAASREWAFPHLWSFLADLYEGCLNHTRLSWPLVEESKAAVAELADSPQHCAEDQEANCELIAAGLSLEYAWNWVGICDLRVKTDYSRLVENVARALAAQGKSRLYLEIGCSSPDAWKAAGYRLASSGAQMRGRLACAYAASALALGLSVEHVCWMLDDLLEDALDSCSTKAG